MNRLVMYSLITAASVAMTAAMADHVGNVLIELFGRVEAAFPG